MLFWIFFPSLYSCIRLTGFKPVEMLEKNGFEIEAYLPFGAFPPYFYIFTGTYFKFIGKGLNLDRIIVPYFLGQFLLFPILLFKNYLNLSMQTMVCGKK